MRSGLLLGLLLVVASCGAPDGGSQTPIPAASETTGQSVPPDPATTPVAEALEGVVAYVGGADPQIHLLDLGSGESRQLTHLRAEDGEVTGSGPIRPALTCGFGPSGLRWAPDGSRLAFAYGGCDTVVYLVDLDGSLQRIGDGRSPTWSPDGRYLAYGQNVPYLGFPADRAWDLMIVDVHEQTEPRPIGQLPGGFYASGPSFSPDGSRIGFAGPAAAGSYDPAMPAAYVMSSDGADVRLLARGASPVGWFADGRLAVIEASSGRSWAIDPATDERINVAGGGAIEDISADGTLVLSSAIRGERNIVRLHELSGGLVGETLGFAPTWSPDGSAFLVNDVEAATLRVIALDGNELATYQLVGPIGGDARARWQP